MPKTVHLETAEDYKKYETDILNCIHWLENTPIHQHPEKRTKAQAFLTRWATGTPTVTVEMQNFQLDLTKKNPNLILIFIGGWIKHSIENPTEKITPLEGNIAGFKSLMNVYAANKEHGMKKDKRIEKLIQMDVSELQQWVSDKLK